MSFRQTNSFVYQPAGPGYAPQAVRTNSFTMPLQHQQPHAPQQGFGHALANARQNSWDKLQADRQHSWNRLRQNSFERQRQIDHGRNMGRQHSFEFQSGQEAQGQGGQGGHGGHGGHGGQDGYGGNGGYGGYGGHEDVDGSQLADDVEWNRNATQVGGVLSSITNGSCFLKLPDHNAAVKSRAVLIPRHNTSSFTSRNYTIIKELGKGSFSRVQLLRDRRCGIARVLKISEGGMGTKQSQMLKNEIHLLSALDHPNIVKIYEYSEDISRGQLLMVLEYVGGGDCQQLLRASAKPQSEAFIAKLSWQLLSVLCYCHARGILHCDIKPENMMITQPTSRGMPELKVIDFGLTHRIDQPSRDFVGTPSYMAPEIVKGTVAYTIKADIWSAGVTCCELLASMAPFGRPQEYKGNIEPVLDNIRAYRSFQDIDRRLSESQAWRSRSNAAKDFIKSLVIADPADRPHADQALDHDWMLRNKVSATSLSSHMLKSIVRFMGASNLMRRCLLIIAARVGSPKMEQIGSVFLSIDDDHTGHISRENLASAISAAASCWEPEFDVDDFFCAADQDGKDVVSFLEFVATCLWGTDDTTNTIAERVFKAMDDDHDGMVHLDECRHLFRDCDLNELRSLPRGRAFGINEWRAAIGCSNDPLSPVKKEQPETGFFAGLIRSLMCGQEGGTGVEDESEVVWR